MPQPTHPMHALSKPALLPQTLTAPLSHLYPPTPPPPKERSLHAPKVDIDNPPPSSLQVPYVQQPSALPLPSIHPLVTSHLGAGVLAGLPSLRGLLGVRVGVVSFYLGSEAPPQCFGWPAQTCKKDAREEGEVVSGGWVHVQVGPRVGGVGVRWGLAGMWWAPMGSLVSECDGQGRGEGSVLK